MKILIFGVSGLIGHRLWLTLKKRFPQVYGTLHGNLKEFEMTGLDSSNIIESLDVTEFKKVQGILMAIQPDVIINAVGITKRRIEINDLLYAINVNSIFPHQLAKWADENGKWVIHFSTDCVFSGQHGNYTELSNPDAFDNYGKTKALGELKYPHTLTIRSSFIGRELSNFSELLEWFLAQKGKSIKGFCKAYYSGVSTIFLSEFTALIIEKYSKLSGLYQLATPEPISKFDLLSLAKKHFDMDVEIVPDNSFEHNATLNGNRIHQIIPFTIPQWDEMMSGIASESKLYNNLRKNI